jgi:hypothetical protein
LIFEGQRPTTHFWDEIKSQIRRRKKFSIFVTFEKNEKKLGARRGARVESGLPPTFTLWDQFINKKTILNETILNF